VKAGRDRFDSLARRGLGAPGFAAGFNLVLSGAAAEAPSIIWMSPSCATVMASISRSHTPAFRHGAKRL
jgi:hypothetical protein